MGPGRRSTSACAVAVIVCLSVAAQAIASVPPTRIVHFRVFSASGRPVGVHVTRSLRGSCFAGSIGLPRPDAWRCMVGNEILDPCLESPKGDGVPLICVYAGTGIRLRLTRPLQAKLRNSPEKTFFPWRLVLAGGDVCERFTGTAAGAVQGEGLVYGCTSGGTTTDPDRADATWTVRYLRKGTSPFAVKKLSQLELVRVIRAIG